MLSIQAQGQSSSVCIPPNGWDTSGLRFEGATTGALIRLELLGTYGGGTLPC
jgi:hypothetical protein